MTMVHLERSLPKSLSCSDIIKYCINNDVELLSDTLQDDLDQNTTAEWIATTSSNILDNVIPDSFWNLYDLEKPTVPDKLNPESECTGLPVLLLVLWCGLSKKIRDKILHCLKNGSTRWQTNEIYNHLDWIKLYVDCICKHLYYAEHHLNSKSTGSSKQELCLDHLITETIFVMAVVDSTSNLFEIITDPDDIEVVVGQFLKIITSTDGKIVLENPEKLTKVSILSTIPENLEMISVLDFFKRTYFIPSFRHFFKIDCFTRLANMIHVLLIKEHTSDDILIQAVELAAKKCLTELDIPEQFPHACPILIVFVKLLCDFIQNSKHKIVTEKETMIMKLLYPAYKNRDGESTKSKLKRILELKNPHIFSFVFALDMIHTRFKLSIDNWHHYLGQNPLALTDNHEIKSEDKTTSIPNAKTSRKNNSASKESVSKKRKGIEDMSLNSQKGGMGTRAHPNRNSTNVTKKYKNDKKQDSKKSNTVKGEKGICSYAGCNNENEILRKCFRCKLFNIHTTCHKKFFADKKLEKDDEENKLVLCWEDSRHTPGSTRNKKL